MISASDKVSAGTFKYNDKMYTFPDTNLMDYTFVLYNTSNDNEILFDVYTMNKPLIAEWDNDYNGYCAWSQPPFSICYGVYHFDLDGNFVKTDFLDTVRELNTRGSYITPNNANKLVYLNYDIETVKGNTVFDTTVIPIKFFNFRHGTLDYSICLNGNDNNIDLCDYIAIFKVSNILLIYTADERPSYKYSNYKHYLHTQKSTRTYGYDLKLDKVILDDTLTKFSKNGLDVAFDKSQLIYSNFVLMDKNNLNQLIFNAVGDYLGEEDMKRYCFRKYSCRWTNI